MWANTKSRKVSKKILPSDIIEDAQHNYPPADASECRRKPTSARLVGRENVIAGTDCGFSQGAFNPRLHPTIVWAKLRTLAEGAELATKQLWS